jgi:hypothetical protein
VEISNTPVRNARDGEEFPTHVILRGTKDLAEPGAFRLGHRSFTLAQDDRLMESYGSHHAFVHYLNGGISVVRDEATR